VIHTRLAVLGTVYGIAFAEFDLSEFIEFVDLPADKCIIVGVGVRSEE